jgi:hypothetical protein
LAEELDEFCCPYCDRRSTSPSGLRFHVRLTHPDKLDEFQTNYYPEMEARFKEKLPE